jgi:hypothetical protein
VLVEDPHVSSMHIVVEATQSDGGRAAWLHDKSSNGSFLNGNRIGKGNKVLARSGDLLSLVVVPDADADGIYKFTNDPKLVNGSWQRPPQSIGQQTGQRGAMHTDRFALGRNGRRTSCSCLT